MRVQGLKTQAYKTSGIFRRILLFFAFGAAIWLLSAHVRQMLHLPLTFSLRTKATEAPAATPAPPKDAARLEDDIALTGRAWYALQLGAFTQENAAWQLSQEFIPRGAAGYVCREKDIYRVFAAAYPTRAEAQSVQTRLSEQGVTTYIQSIHEPAVTLRAQGNEKQVRAVREALNYLDALSTKLYTLSCALDAGEMSQPDALEALRSECATCLALKSSLSKAFDGEEADAVAPLGALLGDLSSEGEALQNSASAARLGAALKRCQLTVSLGLSQFAVHLAAQP